MTATAVKATYTVAEAAELLGISRTTAHVLIREGRFPVDPIRVTGLGRDREMFRIPAAPLRALLGVTS